MTPAQQALAEAAGLETARVYSRTCPEYHSDPEPSTKDSLNPQDVHRTAPRLIVLHPHRQPAA